VRATWAMRLGRAGLIFLVSSGFVTGAIAAGRTNAPLALEQRLRKAGFVAAAAEHLHANSLSGRDAISAVIRFRTAASAKADVLHTVRTHARCTTALRLTAFRIPAIPGAHGIAARRSDGEGYDVFFSDGVFSYDVGAFTVDPKGPPTAAGVAAAATRLYRRVHGRP
jgi:hypothetical protein